MSFYHVITSSLRLIVNEFIDRYLIYRSYEKEHGAKRRVSFCLIHAVAKMCLSTNLFVLFQRGLSFTIVSNDSILCCIIISFISWLQAKCMMYLCGYLSVQCCRCRDERYCRNIVIDKSIYVYRIYMFTISILILTLRYAHVTYAKKNIRVTTYYLLSPCGIDMSIFSKGANWETVELSQLVNIINK